MSKVSFSSTQGKRLAPPYMSLDGSSSMAIEMLVLTILLVVDITGVRIGSRVSGLASHCAITCNRPLFSVTYQLNMFGTCVACYSCVS